MANGELPSPDPEVTDLLTTGLGLEGTAGNECYNAGATNTKLLAKSARNAIKAEALYTQVAPAHRSHRRQAPSSTTTTTDNSGTGRHLRMTRRTRHPTRRPTTSHDEFDRHRRRVLWALPTGLYLIGSRHGDEVNLMTANLVVQVCLEPKLVAVALETRVGDRRSRRRGRGLHRLAPRPQRPRRGAPFRQAGHRRRARRRRGRRRHVGPRRHRGRADRLPVLASAVGLPRAAP